MKAEVVIQGRQVIIRLTPETGADKEAALNLIDITGDDSSYGMINFRGHGYMQAAIEFLVQPKGRGD